MVSNVLAVDVKTALNESCHDSVGQTLKSARTRQEFSIENIARETKIRPCFLKSLEDDNFLNLPGSVYTVGFIRSYCDFLKIPSDLLVSNYLTQAGQRDTETPFKVYIPNPSHKRISSRIVLFSLLTVGGSCVLWHLVQTYDVILSDRNVGNVFTTKVEYDKKSRDKLDIIKNKNFNENLNEKMNKEPKVLAVIPELETPLTKNEVSINTMSQKEPSLMTSSLSILSIEAIEETWIKITNSEGIRLKVHFLNKGNIFDLTPYTGHLISVGNSENVIFINGNSRISGPVYLETSIGFAENKKILASPIKNSIQISNSMSSLQEPIA